MEVPNKAPTVCVKCQATESSFWTNAEKLGVICLDCVNDNKKDKETEEAQGSEGQSVKRKTRTVKTSNTPHNPNGSTHPVSKARGKRTLSKNVSEIVPTEAATDFVTDFATTVKTDYVFHKGSYLQTGDIVSMTDEDNDCYYAQIIGLVTDNFCNKGAVIQWLLPTTESPPPNEEFDPATYIIGPAEDMARDLEYFDFVMHAPSDYYYNKSKATPYLHVPAGPSDAAGYIWTSMNSVKRNDQ